MPYYICSTLSIGIGGYEYTAGNLFQQLLPLSAEWKQQPEQGAEQYYYGDCDLVSFIKLLGEELLYHMY